MYAKSPFKISDYSFYSPTLFIAPTRSTCPSIPLEIIYTRAAPQPLQHAHSSPLVLPQYKHFKQKNVRTLQQRCQTKSTHLNPCISHSASTLGPMKPAMDLTPCKKDPLPLQSQCILPACYSLWCDIALHGIYHWIHKALVIFPQSDQHASMHLHTCPQQAQTLTIPHNNRHFHYTHGPVYWNFAQQVDSLCCLYIPLLCHVSDEPKNLVGNNRQRTSNGAVSKICYVGPYPLHMARVHKSLTPGHRGD